MAITGGMLGAASTATSHEEFVPEVWADGIYKYFARKTVFRGLIDDYSALVKGSGDTINIPEIALKTATAKTIDTLVTYDATHSTQTQLAIDKHYYNAMLFEDVLLIQSNADLVAKYTQMFGEALGRQFDSDAWDQLKTIQDTIALTVDEVLTDALFQTSLATLGENDIPYMDGECSMVVNPTLMADILDPAAGISRNFWRADASGNGGVLESGGSSNGFMGKLFGINVYMSNTVATGGSDSTSPGAIFHKSAAACAVQQDIRVQAEYSIDALGTKVVADMLYGVKVLDDSDNKRGLRFTNA
tara:strand:- start:46 stop:951 length:906 start_codon:yes stop_codon:yes gene_type:complete